MIHGVQVVGGESHGVGVVRCLSTVSVVFPVVLQDIGRLLTVIVIGRGGGRGGPAERRKFDYHNRVGLMGV